MRVIHKGISFSFMMALAGVLASPVAWADGAPMAAVKGYWWTESGEAIVAIEDCGDGSPCGFLRWTRNPDKLDEKNKDKALRGRKILGMKMLWGFEGEEGGFDDGKIYNARDGKTYKSKMRMEDPDTLTVKGCVWILCKGQTWTRHAGDLPPLGADIAPPT